MNRIAINNSVQIRVIIGHSFRPRMDIDERTLAPHGRLLRERRDFAAMELATSWGITTVAHYLAQHNTKRGFWTPESHPGVRNFVIKGLNERLAAQ